MLELRTKLGLESFVRGNVLWEGDHIRDIVRVFLASYVVKRAARV